MRYRLIPLVGLLLACGAPAPSTAPAATLVIPPVASSSAPAPVAPANAKVGPPIKKLVAAPGHTCALLVSGEVACWGGGIGPVVNGYRTDVKQPRIIPGVRNAVDVATGLYHTCIARQDGKVLCWGWNSDGELGGLNPTTDDELLPVPNLDNVVEVASRANHTCARRRDGHVFCWGKNDEGQLGVPAVKDAMGFVAHVNGAVPVPGLTDAVEIVTSHTRSCARRANGSVVCWGEPIEGVPPAPRGQLQAFPEVTDAVGLAADMVTCAIRATGAALCYGGMAHGSIGPGAPPPSRRQLDAKDVVSVALGGAAECAVTRSGSVVCWGEGVSGELGDGTTKPHDAPTPVLGVTDATQVVASWNHMCALRQNRQVVCWGANNEAQLGIGSDDTERMPFIVPGISAAKVSVGYDQSCAIDSANKVLCWGHDVTGAQYFARNTPTAIPGLTTATEIALGFGHGCALTPAGGVVCWGDPGNLGAQLPYKNDTAVHAIKGVADATTVSTGESHSCARRKDGTAVCWGQNHDGQLGDGSGHASLSAVAVKGIRDAVDVRCGKSHACALEKNGEVVCWGGGSPVASTQFRGATAIAPSDGQTCAIHGGKVTCWYGPQRQFEIPDVDDATQISGAGQQTCILRRGAPGSVTCWTRIESPLDLHVTPLDAPTSLAAETEHVCAVSNGKAACWGRNIAGQVGAPLPYRTSATPIGW